jgi:membrane protein YqaA with SNARE-associated domain
MPRMTLTLGLVLASKLWNWLRHLGGPGLLLLGLADNSLIPLPGSMDVLTIWFAVHHHSDWLYYAAMATLGAVIGGYVTYRLARKSGKAALEHRLGHRGADAFYQRFERWGFWAVAVPAILPPPFPLVPFLLAAGAMQYSRKKFVAALTLGRSLRYGVLAYLGVHYGRHFLRFFNKYTKPTLFVLIGMSLVAGIAALVTYLRYRHEGEGNAEVPLHPQEQHAN